MSSISLFENLVQDARVGVRQFWNNASLTFASLLTLALGMGATTAVFSLADVAILRPLPYPEPDRLVTLNDRFPNGWGSPTIPEFLDFQAANESFDQMAFLDSRDYQITGSDEPERVFAARVTAPFFPLLGATPALGRVFEETEIANGASDAVVLSHAFWQRAFGSDPNVLGRRLDVNGVPATVIGVLGRSFSFDYAGLQLGEPVDIYIPYPMTPTYLSRTGPDSARRRVSVVARLGSTSTIESARANMQLVADRLTRDYPDLYRGSNGEALPLVVGVRPLRDAILGDDRMALNLLIGAIAFILLLGCANTMQARLAHGLARHREFAVRAAIGAGRARLIRQLLVESLLLAAAGAIAGVGVARAVLALMVATLPQSPIWQATLDARTFLFMAFLVIPTTVLCGLAPAFVVSRASSSLLVRTANVTESEGHHWLRSALVVGQIALAVVLVFGAGLLFRSLITLQSSVAGFSPDNVLTMQMRMRFQQAASPAQAWQRIVEEVERAPGVEAAGLTTGLPQGGGEFLFQAQGTVQDAASRLQARALFVSPGFFATMRIPLVEGRVFGAQDSPDRPFVAVISETMARQFWPGQSAIGRVIESSGREVTIVGVVGDARVYGSAAAPAPQIYLPYLNISEPNRLLTVRADPAVPSILPSVREAVRRADPDQPIFRVRSLRQLMSDSASGPRTLALLSGAFAFLAIALAAAGLYGAVSYSVVRRVPEIAIRMAMGARGRAVLRLVSARLLVWTAAGLVIGAAGSVAVSRLLRGFLYGSIEPSDPWNFLGACAVFVVVIALAAALPLRRALATDPATALRAD
jgi:putative ABC transport system permease protein